MRESREPILDVGCGVGLLPFYLRERGFTRPVTGLEIDARKVQEGTQVARASYPDVQLRVHDVRDAMPPFRGNIALLDVLHYLEPSRQRSLLEELAALIPPGGILLVRDCPRDGSLRYWLTRVGEIFAQTISWNWKTPLHFPSRASINAAFPVEEFTREETPSWGGTPFNNRLFVFRRKRYALSCSGRGITNRYPRAASRSSVSSRQRG